VLLFVNKRKEGNSGKRKLNVEVKQQSHDKHVHFVLVNCATLLQPPTNTFSSFSLILCKISKLMQKCNLKIPSNKQIYIMSDFKDRQIITCKVNNTRTDNLKTSQQKDK